MAASLTPQCRGDAGEALLTDANRCRGTDAEVMASFARSDGQDAVGWTPVYAANRPSVLGGEDLTASLFWGQQHVLFTDDQLTINSVLDESGRPFGGFLELGRDWAVDSSDSCQRNRR